MHRHFEHRGDHTLSPISSPGSPSVPRIYGENYTFPTHPKRSPEQKTTPSRCGCSHHDEGFFFSDPSISKFPYLGAKCSHAYNVLVKLISSDYSKSGFHEAVTSNMLGGSMWEPGGLSLHFSEEVSRLATMRAEMLTANCSGHCRFYEHQSPSYAELPVRYADFGVIRRIDGVQHPLDLPYTYHFNQDDSHIFCRTDQISQEVKASVDFLSFFYKKVMKYEVEFELATRPKRLADFDTGETRRWNDVEEALKAAFEEEHIPLKVNSGSGPYYGARINIVMRDPYGRFYLHGWMQLDFELPERFGLSYVGEDGSRLRPVLIHRALVAPVEIFLCIILTDCQQLLPFWLSPRQVSLVAVSTVSTKYAHRVEEELHDGNFEINSDFDFNGPLNKRINAAVEAGYTFIIVVGSTESLHKTVTLHTRRNDVLGEFPLNDVLSEFRRFVDEHCSDEQCYEMLEKRPRYREPPL